jgi:hypothetical protein
LSDNKGNDERRRILASRIAQEEQRISEIHAELERRRALVSTFQEQLTATEPARDEPLAPAETESSKSTTLSTYFPQVSTWISPPTPLPRNGQSKPARKRLAEMPSKPSIFSCNSDTSGMNIWTRCPASPLRMWR